MSSMRSDGIEVKIKVNYRQNMESKLPTDEGFSGYPAPRSSCLAQRGTWLVGRCADHSIMPVQMLGCTDGCMSVACCHSKECSNINYKI